MVFPCVNVLFVLAKHEKIVKLDQEVFVEVASQQVLLHVSGQLFKDRDVVGCFKPLVLVIDPLVVEELLELILQFFIDLLVFVEILQGREKPVELLLLFFVKVVVSDAVDKLEEV